MFPWPGCQQTKHSDPACLHVGTETVFGEDTTLSPHRMNKDKLSPSQAAPDKPQTDPADTHMSFPTHLFVTAHTWEAIKFTSGLMESQRNRGLPWKLFSPTNPTLARLRHKNTAHALCLFLGRVAQLEGALTEAIQVH